MQEKWARAEWSMPSKAPTSPWTQCRATQRKSRVVTFSAQALQALSTFCIVCTNPSSTDLDKMLTQKAIDRYEARRSDFVKEGTYPKVWTLLGDLDLGGPNTFSGGERGEFNPTKKSSFGWDDVFYPLNDK